MIIMIMIDPLSVTGFDWSEKGDSASSIIMHMIDDQSKENDRRSCNDSH